MPADIIQQKTKIAQNKSKKGAPAVKISAFQILNNVKIQPVINQNKGIYSPKYIIVLAAKSIITENIFLTAAINIFKAPVTIPTVYAS